MSTQDTDTILSEKETKRLHKLIDTITPPNWHIHIYNEEHTAGELQHNKGNLNIFVYLTNYPESKASDKEAVGITKELSILDGIGYCSIEIDILAHKTIMEFETKSRKQFFEAIEDTMIHEIAHVAQYQYKAYENRFYRGGFATIFPNLIISSNNQSKENNQEMHGDSFHRAYLTLLNRGLIKYPRSNKMLMKYLRQAKIYKDWQNENMDTGTD